MQSVELQTGVKEITLAVDQPEFDPLIVGVYFNTELGAYVRVSRWKLSDEDREKAARGEDVWLGVVGNGHYPPTMIQVGSQGFTRETLYSNMGMLKEENASP
jgi:hypothetical protein